MTLTFNPLRALVVIYIHAKDEGQRSVGSNNRMETKGQTDRRTDGVDCITFLANAVGEDNMTILFECPQYISLFQHFDYCSPMYNADVYFLSKCRPSTILDVYATLDHMQRAFGALYRVAKFTIYHLPRPSLGHASLTSFR